MLCVVKIENRLDPVPGYYVLRCFWCHVLCCRLYPQSGSQNPTPALKQAAEIGVRTYNNPAMQNVANKDAILVLSFGTTYKDSRQKTIDKTVSDIQAAHPNQKVVVAFTSHIIVDRIKANEGLDIPTPEKPWNS